MTTEAAIIAGVFLPSLTIFAIAIWLAPLGWESGEPDERADDDNLGI